MVLPATPSYCDDTGVARAKIMNRTSTCMHMVVRESTDKERELLKRTLGLDTLIMALLTLKAGWTAMTLL